MKNKHKVSWKCGICDTNTTTLYEIFPGRIIRQSGFFRKEN